jgi:hypothetical protein
MFFSNDMKELVGLFLKHEVEFAVCGGFAVAYYGYVRATMDFDLLVLTDHFDIGHSDRHPFFSFDS